MYGTPFFFKRFSWMFFPFFVFFLVEGLCQDLWRWLQLKGNNFRWELVSSCFSWVAAKTSLSCKAVRLWGTSSMIFRASECLFWGVGPKKHTSPPGIVQLLHARFWMPFIASMYGKLVTLLQTSCRVMLASFKHYALYSEVPEIRYCSFEFVEHMQSYESSKASLHPWKVLEDCINIPVGK